MTRRQTAARRAVDDRWELRERPPWWQRLEARITVSLVTIGILCVGASSYLVALTIRYYEQLGRQQVEAEAEAISLAEPYYAELAEAQRETFVARTELLPHELRGLEPDAVEPFLDHWIEARANVIAVEVELDRGAGRVLRASGSGFESGSVFGDSRADWIPVPIESPLLGDDASGLVRVIWAVDPAVQARHQRLGELARDLGKVEVAGASGEGQTVERDEVQAALVAALGVASSLVLFVAILAGILIAQRTTRRMSQLSAVVRKVASGDLSVRAPQFGRDELGLLASAFNTMLDELEETRQRIAYLQRVGAWQEMARRIAHEIKNPLTPIQLAVQQLREKDPKTDERFSRLLRDSVEIVEDEVESLRRMVTSFSQFAKVPEVELEPVELARVLTEFERAYTHIEADLELEFADEDAELQVLGDRQLLKQVLVNLSENAALSMAEAKVETPRILVSAGRASQPGHAYVRVEDAGPGIVPSRREVVFEPYETTRAHGTGLGLPIVKKIVLDHGGQIGVDESERLGGARFELILRIADPSEAGAKTS